MRIDAMQYILLLALTAMFLGAPHPARAILTNGENAIDILGEFTTPSSDATPSYTKGCANNGASAIGFNAPEGSGSVDTVHHRLFLPDCSNNRVLVFTLDGSNLISSKTPANVLGQPDFTSCASAITQSGMGCPVSAAYDATNDRLFVSDQGAARVLVFNTASITNGMNASYVLGAPDFVTQGAGPTQSALAATGDVVLDTANQILYVADIDDNRVVSFNVSPGSIANAENASHVLGQADFTSGAAATTQAGMSNPYGVALDTTNNHLFVGELGNDRVLMFDISSISDGMNATYVLGQPDFVSNAAAITQSALSAVTSVRFDSANQRLFVADKGGARALVYTPSSIASDPNATDVLGQFAVSDSSSTPVYTKSCVNNSDSQIGFNDPEGMAFDTVHHRLFVSDCGNNRVLVFTLTAGNAISSKTPANVLGQADLDDCGYGYYVATQSRMSCPLGLAYDGTNDRLFVAEQSNNRVLVFNTSSITNGMNAANVLGQPDFVSNGAATTQSGMSSANGLAFDAANSRLYVAEGNNNRVLVFSTSSISDGMNAANVLGQADFVSNGNATTQAGMYAPYGLALDAANNRLFVSDTFNDRVLVYDVATITDGENAVNVLGQANFTSNSVATTQAGIDSPLGLAFDAANNRLFVADGFNWRTSVSNNNRVLVYDVASITNGENAVNVLGQPNFTTNGENLSQSGMYFPYSLAFDATNNRLFLADGNYNRVMIFDTASITNGENAVDLLGQYTTDTSTATVAYGQSGPNNDYPPPNALGFQGAGRPELDAVHHRLFVADYSNHRVLVYNLNTDNTFPDRTPDYVLGQPNFTSHDLNLTQSGMSGPTDLAYDAVHDRLFVADPDSNQRVLVYNTSSISSGMNAAYVLGAANFTTNGGGSTQSLMSYPNGVAYDAVNDRLFVGDTVNNRVLVYNTSSISNGMNAANVLGQTNFTNNTANNTQSRMDYPNGMAFDSTNNRLFVADINNNRVLVYDVAAISNGENAVNVLGQTNFTNNGNNGGVPSQSGMYQPNDAAYDSVNNRLFVFDASFSRVLVFDTSSITNGENAVSVLGQADFTSDTQDTAQNRLNRPYNGCYDSGTGRLFVGDFYNNRVMIFSAVANSFATGQNASYVIGAPDFTTAGGARSQAAFGGANGLTYDSGNNQLYVSDGTYNRVMLFSTSSIANGENASDLLGQYTSLSSPTPVTYTTKGGANNGPAALGFNDPEGIALDAVHHRFFVSDLGNQRVLVYNLNTDNSFPDHTADNVLGQADFSSYWANTTQSTVYNPAGLAYDAVHDRLFVADVGNCRILVFDTASITDGENAANVLGAANFTTQNCTATQSTMNGVIDVAYDAVNDRLYAADTGNHRVLVFDTAVINDGENAINVLGQTNFTNKNPNNTQSRMRSPDGVAVDTVNNRLFVGDQGNNRVLVHSTTGIVNGQNAANVLGQTNFTNNGTAATQSGMSAPQGVSYDPTNNRLFVADQNLGRVLVFNTKKITNGMNAAYLVGHTGFTDQSETTTQSGLWGDDHVVYDPGSGRLFVTDVTNNRIMVFDGSFLGTGFFIPGYE